MFFEITDVILIALFIEAIINALKPIWTKGEPSSRRPSTFPWAWACCWP